MPSSILVAHPSGLAAHDNLDVVDSVLFGPSRRRAESAEWTLGLVSFNNNTHGCGSSIAGRANENNNGEAQR
jgi:hypothetical protein